MKIDLDEPYWIIATASDEARQEFWKRGRAIIIGIENEIWAKQVLALGMEKFIEGRMKGCDTFLNKEELQEKRVALEAIYAKLEEEKNERTT